MGDYQFGVGKGEVGADIAEQLDEIAGRHGASFYQHQDAGRDAPMRYWFAARNYGEGRNEMTRDAVLREAEEAGLWPIVRKE